MGAEWSGWLLHLHGVTGCLRALVDRLEDSNEAVAIVAMLADVTEGVVKSMEEAAENELAEGSGPEAEGGHRE